MFSNNLALFQSILLFIPLVTYVFTDDVTSDVLRDLVDETEDGNSRHSEGDCFPVDTGIPGPPGPTGDFGEIGIQGPKGANGLQGRDGYPGENYTDPGPIGDIGERGPEGPKGRPGVTGRRGEKGTRGITGAGGPDGLPGETSEGSSEPGPSGPLGNPGKIGPTGNKGPNGEPGRDGNCTCAEVTDDGGMRHFSAFSVARHDSLLSTDGDEVITWDHVFVNAIGDFTPESGIFTCCIPGYYYFGFHAHKSSSSINPMVQLILNGDHVASALEYGDLDDEDSSSNSVVIHLDYEDKVWLQLYDSTGFHGSHYGYTTYLGYLLDAD